MSRVCQVTGKSPLVGSNVSHSNRHTKRRFEVNLRDQAVLARRREALDHAARLARGMRVIDKLGARGRRRDLRSRGEKI